MLPNDRFDTFRPPREDRHAQAHVDMRLDELPPKFGGVKPLAILISTWNRKAQLARTLERLARQRFRGFTVYLNDDGSEQDIKSLTDLFAPYLDICYRRAPRHAWRSCPSSAYRAFLDEGWLEASTETIAIMHPEIMLPDDGTKVLHELHTKPRLIPTYGPLPRKRVYQKPVTFEDNTGFWVTLQALFLDDLRQAAIDMVDWHTSTDNLHGLPGFWKARGFAHKTNGHWFSTGEGCPWWFAGSARASDPLWQDLPSTRGHATIDMFMITYRRYGRMMDLTPRGIYCYHQAHVTAAVAPEGENTEDNLHAKKLGRRRLL